METSVATLILERLIYFYWQIVIFLLCKNDGDDNLHYSSLDNILSSNLEPWNISTDYVWKKN